MYDANMQQLLPRITCPALLVVGEKDFRWEQPASRWQCHGLASGYDLDRGWFHG
jgi:pimeloyl-ACP methyl ester carboxylesterase